MKLKTILDKLLVVYLVGMAMFFVFGSVVSLIVFFLQSVEVGLITSVKTFLFGLIFLYSGINLIQKNELRYKYCLMTLIIVFVISTLHRLFFITNFKLERIDLNNFLLFGIPGLIIILTNKMEVKI